MRSAFVDSARPVKSAGGPHAGAPYGEPALLQRRGGLTTLRPTHASQGGTELNAPRRAIRDKTEHVIHKMDGEFGERNSYGNDPNDGG